MLILEHTKFKNTFRKTMCLHLCKIQNIFLNYLKMYIYEIHVYMIYKNIFFKKVLP